jgi:hypothetical protein
MPRRILLAVAPVVLFLTGLLLLTPAWAADHVAPPAGDADDYPALDVHPSEHVAIAADPYNTPSKISIFRVDYMKYGFMPIRIIITNNRDTPISLADAHITFITPAGDKLQTAEVPDVERRIDKIKNPSTTGYKLPGPLPRIGNKSATKSKDIEADFQSFEYSAIVVQAHSTCAGFFFYDLNSVPHPLVGGKLNLSTLRDSTGKELFYFEIPFDKYLSANTAGRSNN